MSTTILTRPVHTCPNRAVFQPNCPACVAGALELAGAEPTDVGATPPAMATAETAGCTGGEWCDCSFCPRGITAIVNPPAPMPLPTGARLYRMTTTRGCVYIWATSTAQAKAIFLGDETPLGVPRAPFPTDRPVLAEGAHLWHDEPTPEWSAWFARYRTYLWNRLARSYGECLVRVEGPYPR